jgi:transposase
VAPPRDWDVVTRRPVGGECFSRDMDLAAALLEKENEVARLAAELAQLRHQSQARIDALLDTVKGKDKEIEKLRHRLDQLCRHVFGRRAEYVDPSQLRLAFAMLQAEQAAEAEPASTSTDGAAAAPSRARGGHGRRRLDNLPVERVEIHPVPEARQCAICGEEMRPLKGADEVTKQVEFQPGHFFIRETARIKYSCAKHEEGGVVCPPLPPMPIVKGLPGPGLLAHVATSRYSDHLPFHRLEGIFARHGVEIARSTMCDWMAELAFLFGLIYAEIVKQILASIVVQTDDTIVCVVDPAAEGGSKKGHYWAYRGELGSVAYDYTPTRSGDGPARFLAGFLGRYLQADAFAGYNRLYASGRVLEVACVAHVRRGFYEAKDTEPKALIALSRIGDLYAVEREATERNLDHDARRALRQEKSAPIVRGFIEWLDSEAERALPASPFGQAIGYARNLRDALPRYLEDGRISIDNNRVELCMRHVAIGRKNWEHIQGDEAARRNAVLFSIVMSCRELKIDPFAYFRDVLERISTHPASRIAELTPRYWKPAQPPPDPAPPS